VRILSGRIWQFGLFQQIIQTLFYIHNFKVNNPPPYFPPTLAQTPITAPISDSLATTPSAQIEPILPDTRSRNALTRRSTGTRAMSYFYTLKAGMILPPERTYQKRNGIQIHFSRFETPSQSSMNINTESINTRLETPRT